MPIEYVFCVNDDIYAYILHNSRTYTYNTQNVFCVDHDIYAYILCNTRTYKYNIFHAYWLGTCILTYDMYDITYHM